MESRGKVIVILGPTASGKSEMAIRLAKKLGGEIISADSRQIYRGMDIGTGKVTGRLRPVIPSKRSAPRDLVYFSNGIPHHLIDIINPTADYNVTNFKKDAEQIIANILARGKLPIICGGTGFWIKAIVDNISFPEVKPDKKLRSMLQELGVDKLFKILEKLDPQRAKGIDKNNKVRLIRAIEICKVLGRVPKLNNELKIINYEFLQIGIKIPKEKLHNNIKRRLKKRFRQGMIQEVENLRKKYKLGWEKIQGLGLGYFWIPLYLQNKIHFVKSRKAGSRQGGTFNSVNKKELLEKIYSAERDYAKRQMTWFKNDTRIKWINNYREIEKLLDNFLKK